MSIAKFFKSLFTHSKEEEAHRLALRNFIYESDAKDERRIYSRIDIAFRGDCEDFAFSLKIQIGGEVWHVRLPNEQAHAVLVVGDYCYCNMHKRPIRRKKYAGRFLFIMEK
jgi:hypothetical protein